MSDLTAKIFYFSIRVFRFVFREFLILVATAYYRIVCKKVGKGLRVEWGVWIAKPWLVSIGDNVLISSGVNIYTEKENAFFISDSVQINANVDIDYTGGGAIGRCVVISKGARIYSHSHGSDPKSPPIPFKKVIGNNVWIGASAIILHRCQEIGEGAVVGAGAIVTKNICSHKVVVASPTLEREL